MENKKYIYIASPYSVGDAYLNVKRQIDCADEIMKYSKDFNIYPYTPLMSHFHHEIYPHTYEFWMDQDFAWLEKCDFLIRLGGESSGADREVRRANELDIPVYYDLQDLIDTLSVLRE